MDNITAYARYQRNRVRIGNYTYVSHTLDEYPPLEEVDETLRSFSDIDTVDGTGYRRKVSRRQYVTYDLETEEPELEVLPLSEVVPCYYFTLQELTHEGHLRVEAFKPTFIFDTWYRRPEDIIGDVHYPSIDQIIGEFPTYIEYVLPYGVRQIEDVVQILAYGAIYNCPIATAKYPDSCIWRVDCTRHGIIRGNYPEIVKLLKQYHHTENRTKREAEKKIIDLTREIDSVYKKNDINKFLGTEWTHIGYCTHQAVLAEKYLSNLSARTIAYLLPTLKEYVQTATLELVLGEVQEASTTSTLTSDTEITTKRKRTRYYNVESGGTKESPYFVNDTEIDTEDTKPQAVPSSDIAKDILFDDSEDEESELETDTEM
jgi:hypothetical protein